MIISHKVNSWAFLSLMFMTYVHFFSKDKMGKYILILFPLTGVFEKSLRKWCLLSSISILLPYLVISSFFFFMDPTSQNVPAGHFAVSFHKAYKNDIHSFCFGLAYIPTYLCHFLLLLLPLLLGISISLLQFF